MVRKIFIRPSFSVLVRSRTSLSFHNAHAAFSLWFVSTTELLWVIQAAVRVLQTWIQNKLLLFHLNFISRSHLSFLPHCAPSCFFRRSGLQSLVNPVLHLAQLFDLDLASWYSPLLKMILILNDTAHCWENETSVAASPFECPCEFIKSTSFPVPAQICTAAWVWKNIQGQKSLM